MRIIKLLVLVLTLSTLASCARKPTAGRRSKPEIQGHRGARGLLPENSVPGFMLAYELGVPTMELDLAVSADSQLIVSHEPWFNPVICSPEYAGLADTVPLFNLSAAKIQRVPCGTQPHPSFPDQRQLEVRKPTLGEVVLALRKEAGRLGRGEPFYNIEIKSRPKWDNVYTPEVRAFARLVVAALDQLGIRGQTSIQSFDPRALVAVHALAPDLPLVYLSEQAVTPRQIQARLGFLPATYSPYYKTLSQHQVRTLQKQGLRVVPWTINDTTDMQRLTSWGVDGLITNYPDRALRLQARQGTP